VLIVEEAAGDGLDSEQVEESRADPPGVQIERAPESTA
jgi:hypothetical protein